MAKKWDGSKVIQEIDEALDRATAQFPTNTRSKLSAASPVLTGRLASSWNSGKTGLTCLFRPCGRPRTNSAEAVSQAITYGGNWFISSNLPYTQRAAYDPYNGRRGGGDWFTGIENNLSKDATASLRGN